MTAITENGRLNEAGDDVVAVGANPNELPDIEWRPARKKQKVEDNKAMDEFLSSLTIGLFTDSDAESGLSTGDRAESQITHDELPTTKDTRDGSNQGSVTFSENDDFGEGTRQVVQDTDDPVTVQGNGEEPAKSGCMGEASTQENSDVPKPEKQVADEDAVSCV